MDATRYRGPELGTTLTSGYELVRYLGAGGLSIVYEALAPDGTQVALKLLVGARGLDAEVVARFAREVRLAGSIRHANVVPVLDSGRDDELHMPYLVMPLLCGLDLAALIARVGALHPTIASRLMRQVCKGLSAAHGLGIVHRDIKPGNIFLDHEDDGTVIARVLDFGVAKELVAEESLTGSGTMLGTPVYMAPEQLRDAKKVDGRADVWSLGLTLYSALSARVPFAELEGYTAIALAVHQGAIPSVQEGAPWLDPGLAQVVHGAVVQRVERRCPSLAALADALLPYT